jgi:hypothetical protein
MNAFPGFWIIPRVLLVSFLKFSRRSRHGSHLAALLRA